MQLLIWLSSLWWMLLNRWQQTHSYWLKICISMYGKLGYSNLHKNIYRKLKSNFLSKFSKCRIIYNWIVVGCYTYLRSYFVGYSLKYRSYDNGHWCTQYMDLVLIYSNRKSVFRTDFRAERMSDKCSNLTENEYFITMELN